MLSPERRGNAQYCYTRGETGKLERGKKEISRLGETEGNPQGQPDRGKVKLKGENGSQRDSVEWRKLKEGEGKKIYLTVIVEVD